MQDPMLEDMIREIINIGIGDGAAALSVLVGTRVDIRVPDLQIMPVTEVPAYVEQELAPLGVHIGQDFRGSIPGRSLLCYSRECAIALLESLGIETHTAPFLSSMATATLEEIGNIVLGSCLTTISDTIDTHLHFTVPHVTQEPSSQYFADLLADTREGQAVVVKNIMGIRGRDIEGYLFLLFGFEDFRLLLEALHHAGTGGTS